MDNIIDILRILLDWPVAIVLIILILKKALIDKIGLLEKIVLKDGTLVASFRKTYKDNEARFPMIEGAKNTQPFTQTQEYYPKLAIIQAFTELDNTIQEKAKELKIETAGKDTREVLAQIMDVKKIDSTAFIITDSLCSLKEKVSISSNDEIMKLTSNDIKAYQSNVERMINIIKGV